MTIQISDKIKKIKLSDKVTVEKYLDFLGKRAQSKIADFIKERFTERYLLPASRCKNGFSMMAICCLTIEALESFYQGWEDTNNKSKNAFDEFFKRAKQFSEFRPSSGKFYSCVRCGILHQAETVGGWKINRRSLSPLFNPAERAINADKFLRGLVTYIEEYTQELKKSEWDSSLWTNVKKKIYSIINNCESE